MTIKDLLNSGICLEGTVIINTYDYEKDEEICLFNDVNHDGWNIPDTIKNMRIRYMYALEHERLNGIDNAALIIEVE